MAAKIFKQFGSPITSFSLMEQNAGIIHPAIYRGFDTMITSSGSLGKIGLKLNHSSTGFVKVTSGNTFEEKKSGMGVFPNGFIFHEDGEASFEVDQGGASIRYDLLIAILEYIPSPGSSYISYGVVKSGFNPTFMPDSIPTFLTLNDISLNNPKAIPIAVIAVGANSVSFSGLTFIKVSPPPLGNADFLKYQNNEKVARKDMENIFTKTQTFYGDVKIGGLLQKHISVITAFNFNSNYVLINSLSYTFGEFIFNMGGNNLDIKGFKDGTKLFGVNFTTNITPGTSINIRFINVGSSSRFYKKDPNGDGFEIPEHIYVQENELYTIRLDSVISGSTGVFSLSPLVTKKEVDSLKEALANNRIIRGTLHENLSNKAQIKYMAIGNDTDGYHVTVTVAVKANSGSLLSTSFLPVGLRPSVYAHGTRVLVSPAGRVEIFDGVESVSSITYLTKVIAPV